MIDAVDAEQRADHDVARINRGRHLGQHQAGHGQQTEDVARAAAETKFEELRHREDLHAVIERHEDPAQDQDDPALHLPMRHGHAGGEARAGQPDEMLRADVGGEDRGADLQPAAVPAGQEVILAGLGSSSASKDHDRRACTATNRRRRPVQRVEYRARERGGGALKKVG